MFTSTRPLSLVLFSLVFGSGCAGDDVTPTDTEDTEDTEVTTPCDLACANGTCSAASGTAVCECDPGFEGELCDVNIDDCANNECLNGSTCVDGVEAYTCQCADGWSFGDRCECLYQVSTQLPADTTGTLDARFVGFAFSPTAPLRITRLGVIDWSGQVTTGDATIDVTGLTEPAEVGLYSETELIASATVQPTDLALGGYRWSAITPIELTAGATYSIVALMDGANAYSYADTPNRYNAVFLPKGFRGGNPNGATALPPTPLANPDSWSDEYQGPGLMWEDCR